MKRLFAALLAAAVTVSLAAPVSAQVKDWKWDALTLYNSCATCAGGKISPDSTVFRQGGLRSDTTSAFLATTVKLPPNVGLYAALDSTLWFQLVVAPTANASFTAGADSFYVDLQGQLGDGTWVTATPTTGFNVGTAHAGAWFIENSSGNDVAVPVKLVMNGVQSLIGTTFGATAPTWLRMFGYQAFRFIISSDATGEFYVQLGHWYHEGGQ